MRGRFTWQSAARAVAASLLLWTMGAGHCALAGQAFELRVISGPRDAVSGDDALVQAIVPNDANWTVELNDADVTRGFSRSRRTAGWLALLTGLRLGENTVHLRVDGELKSTLTILNHPRTGPIFSGPHQQPFICQTSANGLGRALDDDCSATTTVQYYYRSTQSLANELPRPIDAAGQEPLGPSFKPYNVNEPPQDLARTVTADGATVNYIVRREVGTINRAVYEILFLHQPGQPLPSPWSDASPGWNGRLIYSFIAGCTPGYRQGLLRGWQPLALLSLGYALSGSTLNSFLNGCNSTLSAETALMVKEHFIEKYGPPVHTIGEGGSGGAMQLHYIARYHPGLVDAIIVSGSFPDTLTYIPPAMDCPLLRLAFGNSKEHWAEEQKTAVSGFATWRTCGNQDWPVLAPTHCDSSLPRDKVYDRVANPKGIRCDIYSSLINVLGKNPKTGFARRPLDNVGVQYGLGVFNSGRISAEQFVDLNERIGGYDEDGNIVPTRMEADPEALRAVYQQGLVLSGGGGLSRIPIVDKHSYTDDQGDNHDRVRAFQMRARLIAANGSAANQAILVRPPPTRAEFSVESANADVLVEYQRETIQQVDRWLDNIAADVAPGTILERVSRSRPGSLRDSCWKIDGARVMEPASYDKPGECNRLYPPHQDPRLVAGAPLSGDVLKCALKPIRAGDYAQALTSSQLLRLAAAFPQGVCDYSRPGVGVPPDEPHIGEGVSLTHE